MLTYIVLEQIGPTTTATSSLFLEVTAIYWTIFSSGSAPSSLHAHPTSPHTQDKQHGFLFHNFDINHLKTNNEFRIYLSILFSRNILMWAMEDMESNIQKN